MSWWTWRNLQRQTSGHLANGNMSNHCVPLDQPPVVGVIRRRHAEWDTDESSPSNSAETTKPSTPSTLVLPQPTGMVAMSGWLSAPKLSSPLASFWLSIVEQATNTTICRCCYHPIVYNNESCFHPFFCDATGGTCLQSFALAPGIRGSPGGWVDTCNRQGSLGVL